MSETLDKILPIMLMVVVGLYYTIHGFICRRKYTNFNSGPEFMNGRIEPWVGGALLLGSISMTVYFFYPFK